MRLTPLMQRALAAVGLTLAHGLAGATLLYSNGFETDLADSPSTSWSGGGVARVASGTGGITSASGGFHAVSTATGAFGRWGGYNYGAGNAVPTAFQEFTTSIDIFLDVGGPWSNDTQFDFSSAINNAAGTHRRDFIFNAGFYDDAVGPGAGTDRFVISASNNSQPGSAFARNPARSPIVVSTTGWYTFTHHFFESAGVLAVEMRVLDSSDNVLGSWLLSNATDLIAQIGGNRYGWFDFNEFSSGLAFDNALLELAAADVSEPAALALAGIALLAAGIARRRRR